MPTLDPCAKRRRAIVEPIKRPEVDREDEKAIRVMKPQSLRPAPRGDGIESAVMRAFGS